MLHFSSFHTLFTPPKLQFSPFTCKDLPKFFVGQRRFDVNRNVRDGMLKRESPGMEANAAVGIAAWRTILQVAFDGTAHLGELTAYLMVATGMQRDFKQEVAFRLCHDTIVEHSLLAAGHFTVVSSGCILLFVARQPMRKGAFWLGRLVGNNS